MPLGNTSYLQIETMAEADNNKYLIYNDGIQAVDDAINRLISVDTSSANVTLLESELTGYVFFDCTGHVVPRTLFVPVTVGVSPIVVVNRGMYVRNNGTQPLTVDHVGSPGLTVILQPAETALVFVDGTDIITVATGSAVAGATEFLALTDTPGAFVADQAVRVNGAGDALIFVDEAPVPTLGTTLQELRVNAGATALEFFTRAVATFLGGSDTPANYTGAANRQVRVNSGETALEFIDDPVPTFGGGDALKVMRVNAGETAYELAVPASGNFVGLSDTPANYTGQGLQFLRVNAAENAVEFAAAAGGVTNFVALSDTPANYTASGGFSVRVNSGATALEFTDEPAIPTLGTALQILQVNAGATALEFVANAGGGGSIETQDDGVQIVAATDTLNFTGPGVIVTNPSANVTEIAIAATAAAAGGIMFEWQDVAVSNGDFETGDLTGWTIDSGTPTAQLRTAFFSTVTNPTDNGLYVATAVAQAGAEFHQDITVVGDTAAMYTLNAELLKDFTDNDSIQVVAEVRNVGGDVLYAGSIILNTSGVANVPTSTLIPSHPSQDHIRLRVILTRVTGTNLNAGIDNITLSKYVALNSEINVVEDVTTARVAANADFTGRVIVDMNNAAANTYTVNTGLTVTEPVTIVQKGAGQTTIVAGAGVTIQSAGGLMASASQYSHMVLTPRGADVYYLAGNLA